jgi:hypothetical protein
LPRTASGQDLLHNARLSFDRVGLTIQFDQQHCRGIGGIAGGIDRSLHRRNAGAIHHLECRGYDTGRYDR